MAPCGGPREGSVLRTYSIELVVQFLLDVQTIFERFIKTSSSKKLAVKMTTLPR